MPDVEDSRRLYGLRPEEFTAARDALVRTLRADKQRERADEVKKLRRPSNLAWALNQLARDNGDLIEAVLTAGNGVKDALDRGDGTQMREAERQMRAASDAAVDAAARGLDGTGRGVTDDARARIAATLRAAVVDPQVAERVRAGTLDSEVEVAGLGLDDMAVSVARAAPARRKRAATADKPEVEDDHDVRAERDERRRKDEARRAARARLAELESKAERLANRADRLAGLAERAEQAAREARAEAKESQAEASAAADEAAAARAELDAG